METKAPVQSIQDVYLNTMRRDRIVVTIFLLGGVRLMGRIKGFDKYSVVLEANNQEQLIFKHAISTVTTARPAAACACICRQELKTESAVLVGVDDSTMDELRELATAAGARIIGETVQHRERPDPATYIGKGKIEELRHTVDDNDCQRCHRRR
jgi:host factor-I protein